MKKRLVGVALLAAVSGLGLADAASAVCGDSALVDSTSVCVFENNQWGGYNVVSVYSDTRGLWTEARVGDYPDPRGGRGRVTYVGLGAVWFWFGVGEYQSGSNSAVFVETPVGRVEQTTPLPALPRLPRP